MLEDSLHRHTFDVGDDLFAMGDSPARLYLLRSGRAKVWRPSRQGSALTLYYVGAGAVAGLVSLVRDVPMLSTVTAVSRLETDYWPASLARELLARDARFAGNGLRIVGAALEVLTDRLEDLTDARADQQIGRALLRLASEDARWSTAGDVELDISRQEIADLTGTTLYTASRTLSDWGRQGLVESRRGRVVIKDADRLAALADVEA